MRSIAPHDLEGRAAFVLRTLGTLDLTGAEGPCRALLAQPKRGHTRVLARVIEVF